MRKDKDLVKVEIISSPDHFFSSQNKTIEQRLEEIKLTDGEEIAIASRLASKTIRDKALGLFKFGEIINTIINWNDEVDKDIREAKKEFLLANYFECAEKSEYAIITLKNFLTNPQGNTLFNKMLRIFDDSPPDMELAQHLSNALRFIINSHFVSMFEKHKYALSQIELLTPQALTILSDYKNWPIIRLESYSASGPRVTSDWLSEFTNYYSKSKSITDSDIIERVRHSINELISGRLIEANLIGDKNAKCVITKVGQLLLPYINVTV